MFLIFFSGLITGVFLSFFKLDKSDNFLVAPVALSMAATKDFIMPVSGEEILRPAGVTFSAPKKVFKQNLNQNEPLKANEELTDSSLALRNPAVSLNAGSLTLAILGDSMVDTMGEGLPYLEKALKKYYPHYKFRLLNYGAGGTNIDYGIQRLTENYQYLGKNIPALISTNPDIVIIESFAYNAGGVQKSDFDHHWLSLAKAVEILKTQTRAKIILLATIAPNKANFGLGAAGINLTKEQAWQHAEKISLYLENTINFANSQKLALVDAYHPSLVNGDGNLRYISVADHLHPSVEGCIFIAELIAQKLIELGWLK